MLRRSTHVWSEAYEAPGFTVQSVIGRSDDLVAGTSYYQDEVEAVLRLVHSSHSDRPHLFLFDELFRGTSTVERVSAAEGVLAELVGNPDEASPSSPHVVIAATHDRKLVDFLGDTYDAYHFSDVVGSDGLSFDYRLRIGPAHTRNAIALLEWYGAPTSVVRRARRRAAELER